MKSNTTHLVNRLQFEIHCPDEDFALNLRHNFSRTYQEQIAGVIDRVCSKYVSEEECIRIDKLEIDLGQFSPHSFGTDLTSVLLNKFEKELTRKLSDMPASQREASRQLSEIELVQFFLQNGTLPWWVNESELDVNEVSQRLFVTQQEVFRQFFYKNRFNATVWQRAAFQLNTETKAHIISFFEEFINAKSLLDVWIEQVIDKVSDPEIYGTIKQNTDIHNLLLRNTPLIFQYFGKESIVWNIFKNHITAFLLGNIVVEEQVNMVLTRIGSQKCYPDTDEKVSDQKIDFEHAHQIGNTTFTRGATGDVEEIDPVSPSEAIQNVFVDKENLIKHVVRHAGIVILAPFLKSFFTALDLLDGSVWKNKDAQYKAVHLLKFLSTGQQKMPEYCLTLEKLFCGFTLESPIPLEVLLEETEINEAEVLLQSVIEHWKVLKNTSISGFRESFLKRDGIITRTEKGWLLQVERKTLDVLLDSVPWGYSTVSLPWNSYIIFTEW
jgi:hypothetical protein